ncbi:IS1/IS1595 family N-terminal zinc-binding domain-containing protein [Pragia fontium]|uniref:IS1/IS1595 family N-terminal zinc-binding domain-containing protein n=1 Tax=Pragia fontium TaxID=82985 RepID=UPI0035A24F79
MLKKTVSCRYCSQTTVKKHGMALSGYQRYLCSQCKRTFQLKHVYNTYRNRII